MLGDEMDPNHSAAAPTSQMHSRVCERAHTHTHAHTHLSVVHPFGSRHQPLLYRCAGKHQVLLLSMLNHPNIVRYVGTLRDGPTLYIFLEYVPVCICTKDQTLQEQ